MRTIRLVYITNVLQALEQNPELEHSRISDPSVTLGTHSVLSNLHTP